jgi:predicted permease
VPREEHPRHRFSHYYNVVGRVRRDASRAAMEEDLRQAGASAATRYPAPPSPWKPRAVPLKDEIVGTAGSTLGILAGAALAVLMLACVNIAGLMLGRAVVRSREVGVRAALGATRWRLTRQLLIESLVLAGVGGTLGVALAFGAVWTVRNFGPADMPRLSMIAVDAQVLGLTLFATVLSAVLFGLAPAWRLARTPAGEALKEGSRAIAGSAQQATRHALAAAEVALAFVLVVSSGLLLRSFVSMVTRDPGFQPQGALTASIELPTVLYDETASREFFRRAAERVRALPGVREAAFSSDIRGRTTTRTRASISWGARREGRGAGGAVSLHHGGLLAGDGHAAPGRPRPRASDGDGAPPVILMNEAAARKYWTTPRPRGRAREPVGQGADDRRRDRRRAGHAVARAQRARAVFPQPQAWYPQRMFLVVRYEAGLSSVTESIRRAVAEIDPQLPLANVRPLESVATAATATRRLTLWLVAAFGLTSFFLAVVGIYGVMAQAVGQRRQEFGVPASPGRDAARHHAARLLERRGDDGRRARRWRRAGPGGDTAADVFALRRDSLRSRDVRGCGRGPDGRSRGRDLPSRTPRHPDQPGHRASRRSSYGMNARSSGSIEVGVSKKGPAPSGSMVMAPSLARNVAICCWAASA